MSEDNKEAVDMVDISVRNDENPFLDGVTINTKGVRVSVAAMGDKDNVIVNQLTGERTATHVTAFKKVDSGSFVKLFAENIAFTFGLNSAGLKAFNLVVWNVQNHAIGSDLILIDKFMLDDFINAQAGQVPEVKMSLATLKQGLASLQKSQIIAKSKRIGYYYINPNFIFNGDRIAFTTMIERKG